MDDQNKQGRLGLLAIFIIAICIGVILNDLSRREQLKPYTISPQKTEQKQVFKENGAISLEGIKKAQQATQELPKKNNAPKATYSERQKDKKSTSEFEEQSEDSESNESETRPMKKNNFKKTSKLAQEVLDAKPNKENLKFTKEDFSDDSQMTARDKLNLDTLKSPFSLQVKNDPTSDTQKALNENMEKIIQAQDKMKSIAGSTLPSDYRFNYKDMERFGIKLKLPEAQRNFQVKLQMREAPEFGAEKNIPEPVLPQVSKPEKTFGVERTKATESPWNNFDSISNY